jgi:CRISPR-associated endonuclease/helicase Cas3
MAVEGDNTMILWAKPDETLHDHTRRVVESGRWLAKRLQLSDDLRQRVELACMLHDAGKATHSFQERMEAAQKGGRLPPAYPHALASFPFVLAIESRRFGQRSPKLATAAVLTHHSPLHPRLYEGIAKPPDFIQQAVCEWLAQWLPEESEELTRLLQVNPAAWLHQEANYPDGSRTLMQQFQRLPVPEFTLVKALLCLADWLASSHQEPKTIFLTRGKQKLLRHLQLKKGLALNCLYQFQRDAEARRDSRLYLQAPTGTGKTEAMLLWAGNAERILYLLPTQATVNAMWRRLQEIYGERRVGIAHSHALLELSDGSDEEPPLDVRLFGSVFAKPVTVATLDQYLLAHLHGRHWEIRRALSRHATVLMDEIHAYEPYTLGLLRAALEADPPTRLVIASATLPTPLREYLGDAPLVRAEDPLWQQKRHCLSLEERSPFDALPDALHRAANGERVLLVVNIVPLAQALYQRAVELASRMERQPHIQLLHARFIYRDRRKREQAIQQPPPGTLLITTQVVEVSLDISYDRLYTELAPLDSLVQRMGRVNRRGEQPHPAPIHILLDYDPRSDYLYDKTTLHQTLQQLQTLPRIPTAAELTEATDQLYQSIWSNDAFQQQLLVGFQTLQAVQRICGCYTIDLTDEQMRQRFTTRKGETQMEVLPEAFEQAAYKLRERKALWQLPNLLVAVPYWWLIRFPALFTPAPDLGTAIAHLPYDAQIGLTHPLTLQNASAEVAEFI